MPQSLLTIQQYLALADWRFAPTMEEGQRDGFYWLRSMHLVVVDPLDLVRPAVPFAVLATYFDWHGGSAQVYGHEPGWRALGHFALSETAAVPPRLYTEADCAFLILDAQKYDDDQLVATLGDFEEPYLFEPVSPDAPQAMSFWQALSTLRPFCYFSYGLSQGLTLIMREHDDYMRFMDRLPWDMIEKTYRDDECKRRREEFELFGPEVGPEVCSVPDCDRLRLKNIFKCYMHAIA